MPTQVCPARDPNLPHQIVLTYDGVSCNCRGSRHRNGTVTYPWFAPLGTAEECLAAFYDPANHVGLT